MQAKNNLSVNILRDENRELDYIPTPNACRIVEQLVGDFDSGVRSFNIIGSYGTGKSSFLWALSQDLQKKKKHFDTGSFLSMKVKVLGFVGEYVSLRSYLGEKLLQGKTDFTNEELFAEFFHIYHQIGPKSPLLVILVDEFGKFLEYAARNASEKELYFIQQFAEFINDPRHNIILVTTLHQNFDAYAFSLNNAQRLEWSKVKGRFREITFNEPVEQLLLLAGQKLSREQGFKPDKKAIRFTTELFEQSGCFNIGKETTSSLSVQLFPLDLFSASVVALSMQRYGQNERSLFSFLDSTGYLSLRNIDFRVNPFFSLSNLYDYLLFNYYSYLSSKYNPDNGQWSAIKNAIERVENTLEGEVAIDAVRLVKSIGLLNIFASKGAVLDDSFWISYARTCVGIENPKLVIEKLFDTRVLLFRKYERRIVLSETTDVDIQSELLLAGDQIGEIRDLVGRLKKYFNLSPLFAKYHYYDTGTPRVFEYVLTQEPEINFEYQGDVDGYINIVFNERIESEDVRIVSSNHSDAPVVYGYFKNVKVIKELVREIEKTKKTRENISKDDKIAHKELLNIQSHQESLLNHYLQNSIHNPQDQIDWYFKGQLFDIPGKKSFNVLLTHVSNDIYYGAPVFKNELVNRSKLSSQIQTARNAYFRHLIAHFNDPDFGFDGDRFPPERTIYLTLLRENNLLPGENGIVAPPEQKSNLHYLWQHCEEFLNSTKKHKRSLADLVDELRRPPFKLKQGLIEFWLPTYIFLKKDELALFSESTYIPFINEDVLGLLTKKPQQFTVKKFDVEGIRLDFFNEYRKFLSLSNKDRVDNQTYVETIRPFLTFYRQLSEYAKGTSRLKKESIAIRTAIAKATDPEKIFFEDFPAALGVNLTDLKKDPEVLSNYIACLQEAVREIRSCLDELFNRFETFLTSEILYEEGLDFEQYKGRLQKRFGGIKTHRLLPHQKTFILRISSALDDRKAWLSSIAQAVVGKTLENLKDDDEALLFDKMKDLVLELDTLTEITSTSKDEDEAIGIEITSPGSSHRGISRYPAQKSGDVKKLADSIRAQLGKDKNLNIAALANLLKEMM